MKWSKRFVDLDKKMHNRASFSCGKDALDDFIKTKASKHFELGMSKTRVLPAEDLDDKNLHPICAFYSVSPGSIDRETFPGEVAKKLPKYPVPIFLIGQLAVHSEIQKQNLGKMTLISALKYLCSVNEQMPAIAIIVDCLDDSAEAFYTKYGFKYLCEINEKKRLFLPMKTAQSLTN